MFLRVKFCDNDFSWCVHSAVEAVVDSIVGGLTNTEAIIKYKAIRSRKGNEHIRRAIVLAAYGYFIARKASMSIFADDVKYKSKEYDSILEYLDKKVSLEEVDNLKEEWENSEVCCYDFYRGRAILY